MQCLKEKFLNDAREAIGAMMNTQVEALCLESNTAGFAQRAATTAWTPTPV